MPENEFEKKVQQKMDGLKLNPSGKVWQKVAAEIKNEKGSRKIFAFVLLALLFIAAGVFIQFNYRQQTKNKQSFLAKENPVQVNQTPVNNDDNNEVKKITKAITSKEVNKDSLNNSMVVVSSGTKKIKENSAQQKIISGLDSENTTSPVEKNQVNIHKTTDNSNVEYSVAKRLNYNRKQKLNAAITNGTAADDSDEKEPASAEADKLFFEPIALADQASLKTIVTNPITENGNYLKNKFKDIVSVKKNTKNALPLNARNDRQNNKWKIGFNLSAGISATQNGYLGVIGAGNSNGEKAYTSPSTSPNGNVTNYYPSKIKPGAGFAAGIFAQKNISPKTIFSIGLNYKTFNSAMNVGNRVDSFPVLGTAFDNLSSRNYFYRSGINTRYKNHFHFIELPLAVNFKLSNKSKRPVYLTTGISVSRLFNSNALQFDTATGKYYSNNNLFNKTQVSISADVLFSLSRSAKNPLLAGPDVNFSFNKIAGTGLYSDRRYSYFGIRLQKCIGKK